LNLFRCRQIVATKNDQVPNWCGVDSGPGAFVFALDYVDEQDEQVFAAMRQARTDPGAIRIRKGACTDNIEGKRVSYSEGENFLIPQILNILTGHFHTLRTPFALRQHNWI
jgi:hypothetical protein